MPGIGQSVRVYHEIERFVKVGGRLSKKAALDGLPFKGFLLKRGTLDLVLLVDDLETFTNSRFFGIHYRQIIPIDSIKTFSEIRFALEASFESVIPVRLGSTSFSEHTCILIGGLVSINYKSGKKIIINRNCSRNEKVFRKHKTYLTLEWDSSNLANIIADGVLAVVLQTEEESKKIFDQEMVWMNALRVGDYHSANLAELHILIDILCLQFGPVCQIDEDSMVITFRIDEVWVRVDNSEKKVMVFDNLEVLARVQKALKRFEASIGTVWFFEDCIKSNDIDTVL